MTKKILTFYYKIFDEEIGDSTIVVGLIGLMIFFVGFFGEVNARNFKSNVLEYNNNLNDNIVFIDGKKYRLTFEEIK
ncbi:MAG: hypothetical protein PHE25_04770 [Candidatus Gracilibacteria bacterium]|nr:hypothetical protein [Candidatus Gracilibacteria bacterium]